MSRQLSLPPPPLLLPHAAAATLWLHPLSLDQLSFLILSGAVCFPLYAAERWGKAVQLAVAQAARVVAVAEAAGAGWLGIAEAVRVGVQVTAAVRVHVEVAQAAGAELVDTSQLP